MLAFVRREAAFYAALAPLLVGSLILSRFDLWPALLVVAALAALLAGRDGIGWAFLGAAVAAKLWPLVLVPLALLWSARRGHARSALAGVAVAALAFVPFALIAPHGLWHSVSGQASRPLQIESLGAALLTTFGHPHVVTTHGSQNLAGHGAVGAVAQRRRSARRDRRCGSRSRAGRRRANASSATRRRPSARSSRSARCSRRSTCSG